MDNENSNLKKRLTLMIHMPLFCTIGGICLLISGIDSKDKPTIIVASFVLLLDLIMIVAFLIDWFRRKK